MTRISVIKYLGTDLSVCTAHTSAVVISVPKSYGVLSTQLLAGVGTTESRRNPHLKLCVIEPFRGWEL